MPSTFSSNLRVELMADGEKSATWGQITNTNLDLLEAAIAEMATISTTGGTYTLSTANGAADEARKAALKITGTLASNSTIQIPAVTKWYLVWNATSGAYTVTIKTASGTGQTIPANQIRLVFCDGTDVFNLVANSVSGGTVGGTASGLTYDLASNTFTGTLAQFNTACSNADFASLAGAESLTNKTVNLANNTLTGTLAQFNTACSDADFLSTTGNAATATLATKGSTLAQGGGNGTAMTFNWSGQAGQPSWLWGSNDGTTHQVYNPSNFNVNSATSATYGITQAPGTNNTTLATTAYADAAAGNPPAIGAGQAAAGTQILWTGVPSWANEVTISFRGLSLSGGDEIVTLIGPAAGLEVSGYEGGVSETINGSASAVATSTTAALLSAGSSAASVLNGHVTWRRHYGNVWFWSSISCRTSGLSAHTSAGMKELAGPLTQVAIDTNGTNTFDAGTVNIYWRG